MLQHPSINDPTSKIGNLFRRRFRVPYSLFKEVIVEECKRVNLFGVQYESKTRIPIEFKILMSLRILGRENVQMLLYTSQYDTSVR